MKNDAKMKRLFCCYYAVLGNAREAAVKAGYPPETALSDGMRLLGSAKTREYIKRLSSDKLSVSQLVRTGLERLAFGSSGDAARLVFSGEIIDPSEIERLDLFNVSEIKKDKGGGVEVKLFDRQKALEKLYEYVSKDSTDKAENLIRALGNLEADIKDEV